MLSFGARLPRMTWAKLGDVDRRRAALLYAFVDARGPIDDLLSDTVRRELRGGARRLVATWWQHGDAGLLFGVRDKVIGQAAQYAFASRDRRLWARIAGATRLPRRFDWRVRAAERAWKRPALGPILARLDGRTGRVTSRS